MRRDPLQVLRRLRDATMNEASRELANGLQRKRRVHGRVLEPGQVVLRGQVDAGSGSESALFGSHKARRNRRPVRDGFRLEAGRAREAAGRPFVRLAGAEGYCRLVRLRLSRGSRSGLGAFSATPKR